MKNAVILYTTILLFSLILSFSAYTKEEDLSKNFGIGLQGNYPLLGGISFRYYGLSPVYFQIVGRFIMNGDERDNMLGGGISYAVFELKHSDGNISRLYFSLEGGERYKKYEEYVYDEYYYDNYETKTKIFTEKTYGIGLVFGGEFSFTIMSFQIGVNAEIGQGYGKKDTDSESKKTASFILGGGIHVYF